MLRIYIFLVTSFFSIGGFSQAQIYYQNCEEEQLKANYPPAPCSIVGKGVETSLFMIQIGVYRTRVNPKEGVIMIPFKASGDTEGFIFRYYVAAIFPSRLEAETFLTSQHIRGDFCDAIVVPFPFAGVVGYK